MSHTTTTREANVIEITTDHYVIRMHRKTARPWQKKDFDKKVRLYVSGTQVTTMEQPEYSIKGENPELDAAWRKYNRLELLAMKAAYSEAFAEAGLEFDGRWGFSRKAGCSCGCSAGFVHTEPRIMAVFGDRDATPERVDSIYVSVRKQEQDPNLVAGDAMLEPATAEDVEDELEDARLCSCGEVITSGSDQCLGCYVATMKNAEPSQATDDEEAAAPNPDIEMISVTLTRGAWNNLRGIIGRAERAYEADAKNYEALADMLTAQGVSVEHSYDNANYSREQAEFARQLDDTFTKAVL